MHIADGIMSTPVCLGAQAVSWSIAFACGRSANAERAARMGAVGAAVFTVSLISFPAGGVSVHFAFLGLAGILLGPLAFPAILAVLLLQALLLQHGGILSLGLNAFNMGTGALAAWLIWRLPVLPVPVKAFAGGFAGAFVPALLMAGEFALSGYGSGFALIAAIYSLLACVEGAATTVAVHYLGRVKPGLWSDA